MEEVNYNETVVVPFLEKKCKDLLSLNLVLEAKLLIEQTKLKNFENFANGEGEKIQGLINQVENLRSQVETIQTQKNNIETERNNLSKELSTKENNLAREISVKDSVLNEYKQLKEQFDSLTAEFNAFKQSINTKKVKEPKVM